MTPTPVVIVRGDTWKRTWTVKDANGSAVNLTGCTARLHIRNTSQAQVAVASTQNNRITITGGAGKIEMAMPASVMAGLSPGSYTADIEVTFPDGTVRTYERIALTLLQDATYD